MRRPSLPVPARRAIVLGLPLALAACGLTDRWFGEEKTPIPGKRLPALTARNTLAVDSDAPAVAVPAPTAAAAWPQPGGTPSHAGGNLALGTSVRRVWRSDIGAGSGYRQRITAMPVVADGRVFTMDADAEIRAFAAQDGSEIWRAETRGEDDRSTNVGGGIALADGILYAATGRGDLVAFRAATGDKLWAVRLPGAARGAPTIVEDRLFVPLIGDALAALARADGKQVWLYQAGQADITSLGAP